MTISKLGNDRRIEALLCPWCRVRLDGVTAVNKTETPAPRHGALAVCLYCCNLMSFDDAIGWIKLDEERLAALDDETRATLQDAQREVFNTHARRRAEMAPRGRGTPS